MAGKSVDRGAHRARVIASAALLSALVLAFLPGDAPAIAPSPSPSSSAQVARTAYTTLPLAFAANAGQEAAAVRFVAHGSGFSLALTEDALLFALDSSRPTAAPTLRFTFPGADLSPVLSATDPLPGTVNYFLGNDPTRWRTDIPTARTVRYTNLYPGIDLTVYGNEGGGWEYDVVIAPGADPAAFALAIAGADGTTRDTGTGDLVLQTAGGEIRQRAPVLYQDVAGVRHPVTGDYAIRADGTVGFTVGAYDRTLPLVIDPSVAYSTYLGGNTDDHGQGIAVDTSGNAYVTGVTSGSFPTTAGAYQTAYGGGGNGSAFVTKLNATGSALLYSTYLGGSGGANGTGIAVDTSGNAYVTGNTGSNFPTTAGAYQTTFGGSLADAFVTKLNATGSALVYSTYLGGTTADYGTGIAVDTSGNAYVTGSTQGGFPTTVGASQTTYGGGAFDAFVTKLNAAGSALTYSTYLGGSRQDDGNAIAVDTSGNAYVTGDTLGLFPTTAGAFQTAYSNGTDAFVAELNATGSALVYSTYLGGTQYDSGSGIAVDTSGNAYVTGPTQSGPGSGNVPFPTTPGAFQTTFGGFSDAFVTKLNATGTALVYSTYLGGSGSDGGNGIAVDTSGNASITGSTLSSNFPTTPGAFQTTFGGSSHSDGFMTQLNAAGTALVYSTYLGGSAIDYGTGIAVDTSGNVAVTGSTQGGFPTTAGAYHTTFGGGSYDAFVAKFSFALPPPNPLPNPKPAGSVQGGPPAPLPMPPQPAGASAAGGPPAPLPPRRP